MSFSGMQNHALSRRDHDGHGGLGWIVSISMAATFSIVMKWWINNVENRKNRRRALPRSSSEKDKESEKINETGQSAEADQQQNSEIASVESYEDMSFEEAASKIRESSLKIATQDKLVLYGLYKQATQGDAPTFFLSLIPTDQAKYSAWSHYRQMPRQVASAQYIKQVASLLRRGENGATNKSSNFGTGVTSRPIEPEPVQNGDLTAQQRLLLAAFNNDVKSLRYLLDEGVNVDQRDEGGQTALHMAADAGAVEAVNLLLKHGANVLASDQYGISALQAAVIAGKVEVCEVLLEHGADPDQPDQDGDTPRLCAEDDGAEDMQALFDSRDTVMRTTSVEDVLREEEEE